jgi:hypothetical protein
MEPRSGTRRKLSSGYIVNCSTSIRSAIDAYGKDLTEIIFFLPRQMRSQRVTTMVLPWSG